MMQQLFRFGVVGVVAMAVHWLTVALIVPWGLKPLLANVLGFLVAFQVSYFGHSQWTFEQAVSHRQGLPRFFLVAVSSFGLNESLYYLLLSWTTLDYRSALAIVLVAVAAFTFLLSRLWAFRA